MDGKKWTEREHAWDRACRVDHAWGERFYRPWKGYGRRAAKPFGDRSALTRSRRR